MTTLITGASGFLGGVVLERLLQSGTHRIRCLVRPSASHRQLQLLQSRHGRDALDIVEGTLTRRRDVERALAGVECVVHLAASLQGAAADIFLNTVVGTNNLYHGIARSAVRRLVTVSTVSTYALDDVPTTQPVQESTGLEPHPELRDTYTHSKIRQELLLSQLAMRSDITCIVLRPGPLYGRGRGMLPSRVGLRFPGLLLQLGGAAPLPLCYVDNCAEAIRLAACDPRVGAGAYNVVDFDTPTTDELVARYRRDIGGLRVIRLPYVATELLAYANDSVHRASRGQLPLVLTPYRVRNMWRGHRFDTRRLTSVGWQPPVPTSRALDLAFHAWRVDRDATGAPTVVTRR